MAGTIKELRQQNKAKRQLRRQNRKEHTSGLDLSGAPTFAAPAFEATDFTPVGNLNLPQIDNFQMLDIAPAFRNRGEAFNAARKRGDKTFWYGGKEYTTETKEEQDARLGRAAQPNKPISKSNPPQQQSPTSRGVEGTRENTLGVFSLEPETKETKFQFNYDRDGVGSSNPDIKVWLNKEKDNTRSGVVVPQWRVTDRNTFLWNDPAITSFAGESTLGPYYPDYGSDEYEAYLQAQDTEAVRRRKAQERKAQAEKQLQLDLSKYSYSTVPFKRLGGKFPVFRNGGIIGLI